MSAKAILADLKANSSDSYKSVIMKHGVTEPIYGTKIEYMKTIVKRVKKDYQLALDLYDTGVYDARYLAGLIADDDAMTKKDLERWITTANCSALAEFTVPWVASQGRFGAELGLKWIDSKKEIVATAGWSTLSCVVSLRDDPELAPAVIEQLLDRIEKTIHDQPNRVKFTMNGFVIAVGSYIPSLNTRAKAVAKGVGKVSVNMGDTACKVPDAAEYIKKVENKGGLGKKRKTVKC